MSYFGTRPLSGGPRKAQPMPRGFHSASAAGSAQKALHFFPSSPFPPDRYFIFNELLIRHLLVKQTRRAPQIRLERIKHSHFRRNALTPRFPPVSSACTRRLSDSRTREYVLSTIRQLTLFFPLTRGNGMSRILIPQKRKRHGRVSRAFFTRVK